MLKYTVLFKRKIKLKQIRFFHQLQLDKGSYLYHPGNEPLSTATYAEIIEQIAKKYPNRIAVKSIHENLDITYEELLIQADSFGYALRNNGFEKGDRFGIWSHNCAGWIIACIAALRAGLVSVLINPVYEAPELSYCINKTEMKGILVGDAIPSKDYYKLFQQVIPELASSRAGDIKSSNLPSLTTIVTAGKTNLNGTFTLDSLTNEYMKNDISRYVKEIKSEDGCLIQFTSGTTGSPKAPLDSNKGIVNNTYYTGLRNNFNEGNQIICVQVPLFHALGSIVTLLGGLTHGATLVLASPTYSVTANINAILAQKCTAITGTPTMYVDILSQIKSKGVLPMNLRMALAAGAPCSPELIHQMNKYLHVNSVRALYGMTETTASAFQSLPDDSVDVVADTVGYIQDHVEVQVVDDNGARVPFGDAGELMVRGYVNMISYWNDPEKTKEIITNEGWLHTGDKFAISPDGYGRIVGRIKDIIVRGGENIAPKEIEDVLNSHPDILESQVIGVSDERLGEELCAVLRIKDGATFDAKVMSSFCAGKIAKFKIPRLLKTINEFPKTASGKIRKHIIKEMIESGKL